MNNNENEYTFWAEQIKNVPEPKEPDSSKKHENTEYDPSVSVKAVEVENTEYGPSVSVKAVEVENTGYDPSVSVKAVEVENTGYETLASTQKTEEEYFGSNPIPKKSPRKKHNFKKTFRFIGGAALFGVIASCSFFGINQAVNFMQGNNTVGEVSKEGIEEKDVLNQSKNIENENKVGRSEVKIPTTSIITGDNIRENDVTEVVKNTMPAIVSIVGTFKQQGYSVFGEYVEEELPGSGSGIIVGKNDSELLVVTNNHVVNGASSLTVSFIDKEVVTAEVKGTDTTEDLAVLAIKIDDIGESTLSKINVAMLGDSEQTEVGEKVVAIGNALGYGQSVTVGYVSAKNRSVSVDNRNMELLQTDAAINPGNSGGALLNMRGEVIGINSVKYSDTSVEGIGYAIPISKATPIINDLMNREQLGDNEKGYLGVTIEEVTEEENKAYNMPIGIFVSEVSKDGAAKKAGIMPGDIIVKINDMEVKTRTALQEKVNSYRSGTEITLAIMRYQDGKYVEKEVKVILKSIDSLGELNNSAQNQQDQKQEKEQNQEKEDQEKENQGKENQEKENQDYQDLYDEFFDFFYK